MSAAWNRAERVARREWGHSLLTQNVWACLREALKLSSRELQIVQSVFEDQKEERIAFELGISRHTVNTYFQRLYTKLHVSSRPQLIVRVMAEYLNSGSSYPECSFVDLEPQRTSRMSGAHATIEEVTDENLTWRSALPGAY